MTNQQYEERRKENGFEGYCDLPEVINDAKNVREGIKGLGAKNADIIEMHDIDFQDFSKVFQDVRDKVGANH